MKLKAHEVAELVGGIVEGDEESTIGLIEICGNLCPVP